MSNFRYFSSQLLQEVQVFIHLFILPNFRCLSSQFPQEAPVPPASDIYAEVSHKKWGEGGILEIGSTASIAFGRQKYIFDKLLDMTILQAKIYIGKSAKVAVRGQTKL